MVIVITLQSQFASLAQKSARNYSASRHECRWMFTENKADETFHGTYTNIYSMADRRDIDRTYKCVSEWRFFLVKSCICSFILSCFWQPYECVTRLSKVFWVVVSRYVCYSVCFSIFDDRCGSLWVVVDRCGSLWIVVDRCGSFRVLVTTSNIYRAENSSLSDA